MDEPVLTDAMIKQLEQTDNDKWVVPVLEFEDGELGFEIPDVIMKQLGLNPGDIIVWEETESGWLLKKVGSDG